MTIISTTRTFEELAARADERHDKHERLKKVIVERLDLGIDPAWITDDQPLFGRGLELDSVDGLELMVGIEMEFGAVITDDETDVFGSVSALVDRIESDPSAF